MKENAAGVLEKTLKSLLVTDTSRVATVEELRKDGIRPLAEILSSTTANHSLILKAIVILIAILNGTDLHLVHTPVIAHFNLHMQTTFETAFARSED